MQKIITLVAVAACVVLTGATPADAKIMGLHHVEIAGPGIDGTLVVSHAEFGRIMSEASPALIALDAFWSPRKEQRPEGSLGPEFRITYVEEWFLDGHDFVRLTALLYPFADDGPVTRVLPDQRLDPVEPKRVTRAGWLPYPEELVANLQAAGLPSEEAAELALAAPSPAWPWALAGSALALLLWTIGSRPRTVRSPQPVPSRP